MPITFLISLVASLQLHLFQFTETGYIKLGYIYLPDEVGPVKVLRPSYLSLERQ